MIAEYKPIVFDRWLLPNEPNVAPGEMRIFKVDGVLEAVDFICPCGCGSECYTPVTPMNEPKQERSWQFDEATTTLSPSVRFTAGCKAHFNIENGKTVMHGDSGK